MAIVKTNMSELSKLALDLYNNRVEKFSNVEAEKIITNAILDAVGGEMTYYNFMQNKHSVFAIISQAVGTCLLEATTTALDDLVEVHNTSYGDTLDFVVENNELYKVSTICEGTNDIRRQRLTSKRLQMSTFMLAIKIYEDISLLLAGRCSFVQAISKISASLQREISSRVANVFEASYSSLNSQFVVNGTFSEEQLLNLCAKVEGATGRKVKIYGTAAAVGKITGATDIMAASSKEDIKELGHVRMFKGYEVCKLGNNYNPNTNAWSISNDRLYVIPEGEEKLIKLVFEGTPFVQDSSDGSVRSDLQIEYFISQKLGIAILTTNVYGAYIIQ